MAGTFGAGIKTVQRGVLTLDANPDTVTITSVVTAKSILFRNFTGSANNLEIIPRAVLTNTTTITFDQTTTHATPVAWQVVEYY